MDTMCRNTYIHYFISMEILGDLGYLGLFIASFLAGSVLPFASEALLGVMSASSLFNMWLCLIIATAGNTLGGTTCYYIGRMGKMVWIEKFLRIPQNKLSKAQQFLQGKGSLCGFFAFLPFVGDAIIVALGLMRANVWGVNLSMLIGKFLRYYLIVKGVELTF